MKPTTNFDKEALRWSLSWHPEDRCDGFTREAILASAPPASGVYGLFNSGCQVFIGEAANIQDALLRLESETDFHSTRLRPTGFAFELCAPESRKSRADELIATFQPVLQARRTLAETWAESDAPIRSTSSVDDQKLETHEHHDFPVHKHETQPKGRRLPYLRWTQAARLAAILIAIALVLSYLGTPAINNIQQRANAAGGETPAGISTAQPSAPGRAGRQLRSSIDPAGTRADQSAAPARAQLDLRDSGSVSNRAEWLPAKNTLAEGGLGIHPMMESAKASPGVDPTERANSGKKWSVQISAAPAKDTADRLAKRLKANGYDGYVVQAEVKGQTYYRVRVGRFASREDAESVRHLLAREESYRDAFLTGD